MRRTLLAATFAAALAQGFAVGAASAAPGRCPQGLRPATTAEVFFGQDINGGAVSDADWRSFLADEISPRFPAGLTVSDVYGQWRGPKGDFVREPSKALFVVLGRGGGDQRRLALIREAYKRQFRQDSVLLVEERACVSF